jgi:hypothetical protein
MVQLTARQPQITRHSALGTIAVLFEVQSATQVVLPYRSIAALITI